MTSLVAQMVKCLPTMQETQVQSLGWDDLLEKEMAIHSSILPGKSHGSCEFVWHVHQLLPPLLFLFFILIVTGFLQLLAAPAYHKAMII